jgi:hypothetical protein
MGKLLLSCPVQMLEEISFRHWLRSWGGGGGEHCSEYEDGFPNCWFPNCSLISMIVGGQMKNALITWLHHFQAHRAARFPHI